MGPIVVVAGATGNLGGHVTRELVKRGAVARALVRRGTPADKVSVLRQAGAEVVEVDFEVGSLTTACAGASCVVSTLAGLRGVIVDAQSRLLEASVAAGVPRFIPSDYSIDFTKYPGGNNRNLDLRREFHAVLDKAPIAATSIFNGAFADMLTGQAPFVLFERRRTLAWGDPDVKMDLTSVHDSGAYTAAAALDPNTPRALRIAGDQISSRELAVLMTELTGTTFKVLRPAGLGVFRLLIKLTRAMTPTSDALYPPWQGMQYMHDMMSGVARHASLDNGRYPMPKWTTARDVLLAHLQK